MGPRPFTYLELCAITQVQNGPMGANPFPTRVNGSSPIHLPRSATPMVHPPITQGPPNSSSTKPTTNPTDTTRGLTHSPTSVRDPQWSIHQSPQSSPHWTIHQSPQRSHDHPFTYLEIRITGFPSIHLATTIHSPGHELDAEAFGYLWVTQVQNGPMGAKPFPTWLNGPSPIHLEVRKIAQVQIQVDQSVPLTKGKSATIKGSLNRSQ